VAETPTKRPPSPVDAALALLREHQAGLSGVVAALHEVERASRGFRHKVEGSRSDVASVIRQLEEHKAPLTRAPFIDPDPTPMPDVNPALFEPTRKE
jgi:TnpA family transposase